MPLEEPARLARDLASHGFTADREAITLLAGAEDPESALRVAVEAAPEDELKLSAPASSVMASRSAVKPWLARSLASRAGSSSGTVGGHRRPAKG